MSLRSLVPAALALAATIAAGCGGGKAAGRDAAATDAGSAGSFGGTAGGAAGSGGIAGGVAGSGGTAGASPDASGAAGSGTTQDAAPDTGSSVEAGTLDARAGAVAFAPAELVTSVSLSITTTGVTKALALHNATAAAVTVATLAVDGQGAAAFVVEGAPALPAMLPAGGDLALTVRFRPPAAATATTAYAARLTTGTLGATAGLFGLAMNAANSEPALADVVRTLGYAVNVGGTTTTLGTGAALIGDEVTAPRFTKAHAGMVTLTPVARYSPLEAAPYGTYTGTSPNVTRTVLATLSQGPADNVANRTLFPPLDAGAITVFDPGAAPFGLYAESASNAASLGPDGRFYQEDALNDDQAGVLPIHRFRVYPLMNRAAQAVADAYLVVCEEASNSDYQDYVFVISNVAPAR